MAACRPRAARRRRATRAALLVFSVALGACHSIHDPNIVAAERLPEGPVNWLGRPVSPPAPPEKEDCSNDQYRQTHEDRCPPLRTDYHCDNPVVRQVFGQSCAPRDPPKWAEEDKKRRN
jgi:hypothetical protein